MDRRFTTRSRQITEGMKYLLALVGCFFALSCTPAMAMEVQPPILTLSAKAGASTASVFLLKNSESVPQTYAFTIQGFVPQGEDGQQLFLPATELAGLPSWLYLKMPQVTLQAGEVAPIPVVFQPSLGAVPGGYQAVVFAMPIDPRKTEGVTLGSRVGVLVLATVEGEVRRSLEVESLAHLSSRFLWRGWPRFEAVIRNQGDAHEAFEGQLSIKTIFGGTAEVISLPVDARSIRVLPHSSRRFVIDPLHVQGNSGWGLGLYRAQLVVGEPFFARANGGWFFVLPWKTFSLLLFVIVVVLWRKRRA